MFGSTSLKCPGNWELWRCRFNTNGLSDPSGLVQQPSDGGVALARSAVGTYTLTFPEAHRPQEVAPVGLSVVGAEQTLEVRPVSYVASTGVFTFKVYSRLGDEASVDEEEQTVTDDAHEAADAGFISAVTATTATSTGAKTIVADTPAAGQVKVEYAAGVATLTFAEADEVTECSYTRTPGASTAEVAGDTTAKAVSLTLLLVY